MGITDNLMVRRKQTNVTMIICFSLDGVLLQEQQKSDPHDKAGRYIGRGRTEQVYIV